MKLRRKFLAAVLSLVLLFVTVFSENPVRISAKDEQKTVAAQSAVKGMVYTYSPVLTKGDCIFYLKETGGENPSYCLCCLNVTTGIRKRLVICANPIVRMYGYGDTLYYSTYIAGDSVNTTFALSIKTGKCRKDGLGDPLYVDENGTTRMLEKAENNIVYRIKYLSAMNQVSFKDILTTYEGNSTLTFVKNIGSTQYFSEYDEKTDSLNLLSLSEDSKTMTIVTGDKVNEQFSSGAGMISDVIELNGSLYYNYGAYEGTADIWNGTLVRLDQKTGKKTVVAKLIDQPTIEYSSLKIYYNLRESVSKHKAYNTKTGKTTTYTCKTADNESFQVLGKQTYCIRPQNHKYMTISRFASGTNRKNQSTFCKIPYKQNKKYYYYGMIQDVGEYYIAAIEVIDFKNKIYDSNGRYVAVKWFVLDRSGKVVGKFS